MLIDPHVYCFVAVLFFNEKEEKDNDDNMPSSTKHVEGKTDVWKASPLSLDWNL